MQYKVKTVSKVYVPIDSATDGMSIGGIDIVIGDYVLLLAQAIGDNGIYQLIKLWPTSLKSIVSLKPILKSVDEALLILDMSTGSRYVWLPTEGIIPIETTLDGYDIPLNYAPINYAAPKDNIIGEHIARIDKRLSGTLSGVATDLVTNTGLVHTASSPAPTAGQVLTATGPNDAVWANIASDASDAIPQNISTTTNSAGTQALTSRADHIHMISVGTTAGTVASGNDSRLSDARTPLAHHLGHNWMGLDQIDGYSLWLNYSPSNWDTPIDPTLGETISEIDLRIGTIRSDYRWTNARPPTPHAATTHKSGQSDAIDGYYTSIVYSPINYAAPIDNIIGEHISRIDEKLASIITPTDPVFHTVRGTAALYAGPVGAEATLIDHSITFSPPPAFTNGFDTISSTYNEGIMFDVGGVHQLNIFGGGTVQFGSALTGAASPFLTQAVINGSNGSPFTIRAQNAGSGSVTGGDLHLSSGSGTSGSGSVYIDIAGSTTLSVSAGSLALGPGDSTFTSNGSLALGVNTYNLMKLGVSGGVASMFFDSGLLSTIISQTSNTTAGHDLIVAAQSTSGGGYSGGTLHLSAGAGTYIPSSVHLELGGTAMLSCNFDGISANSNFIHHVTDPVDPQDAATLNYVDGYFASNLATTTPTGEAFPQTGSVGVSKKVARADHVHAISSPFNLYAMCVATGNITLSGTQTIDGLASLAFGSNILVVGQSSPVDNGLWVYGPAAWVRSSLMPAGSIAEGTMICVAQGTSNGPSLWVCTNAQWQGSSMVGSAFLNFAKA